MITFQNFKSFFPSRFSAVEYRALNKDLRQLTLSEATNHWKTQGKSEGRVNSVSKLHISRKARKSLRSFLAPKAAAGDLELDVQLIASIYQVHEKEFGKLIRRSSAIEVCNDLQLPPAVVAFDSALTFAWIEDNAAQTEFFLRASSTIKDSSLNEFDKRLHLALGLAPLFPSLEDPQLKSISESSESFQEECLKLFKCRLFQSLWVAGSAKSTCLPWKSSFNVLANSNAYNVASWRLKYSIFRLGDLFRSFGPTCKTTDKEDLGVKSSVFTGTENSSVPSVSIITSTYHAEKYLRNYLISISNLKEIEDYELIVIDANEDDVDFNAIIKYVPQNIRLKIIRTKKRINLYEALNLAILESQSEFIAFAMTDDFRFASSIEKQVDLLRNNLDLSIAYGDMFWSLKPNANPNAVSRIGIGSALPEPTLFTLLNFCLPHCAPLWRREIHNKVGYFDESFESAGDWDFWLRCAREGLKFGYINQTLGIYFLNPSGLSTSSRVSRPRLEAEKVRMKNFDLFFREDTSIGGRY